MEESALTSMEKFPRLGYACLNSELRDRVPSVFCSRTCRIATIEKEGTGILKELARRNVADLKEMLVWNAAHNIHFMRMSSGLFPFASHPKYGYPLDFCKNELEEVGQLAKKLNQRLTLHPGQTNNLGSPHESVVAATKRDLSYHASILNLMQLNQDSVMIIHGGGVYGDKNATLLRFAEQFRTLDQDVRDRLVIENDEICYSAEDLLGLSEEFFLPIVFDWHHHNLNPGTIPETVLLQRIAAVWKKRGIRQKMHYSESRPGATSLMEKRAHSDFVQSVPFCGSDIDVTVEAKAKEKAVLKLYEKYNIATKVPGSDT